MNNVKDPRKAQELAVQMLPLADAWQADIIAPVCTNDDFKALLVALSGTMTVAALSWTASLSPRASWVTPSRKKSSARFLPSSTIWPKLSKDAANSDLLDLPLLRREP